MSNDSTKVFFSRSKIKIILQLGLLLTAVRLPHVLAVKDLYQEIAQVGSQPEITLDKEQNLRQLTAQIQNLADNGQNIPQNFILRISDFDNQSKIEQKGADNNKSSRISLNLSFPKKVANLVKEINFAHTPNSRIIPLEGNQTSIEDQKPLFDVLDSHEPGKLVHFKINSSNDDEIISVLEKILKHPHSAYVQINSRLQLDSLVKIEPSELLPNDLENRLWLNSVVSDCSGNTSAKDLLLKNLSNGTYPFRNIGFTYNSDNFSRVFSFTGTSTIANPLLVAVIDSGITLDHFQFSHNVLVKNELEVENNGIDDDQNGFIDDIYGGNIDPPGDGGTSAYIKNGNINDTTLISHGTHVSGIVASGIYMGRSRDDFSQSGAYRMRILPIRFTDGSDPNEYMAIIGIDYAISRKVKVINASWGKFTDGSAVDLAIKEAVARAAAADIVFVTSAGNNNKTNIDDKNYIPASLQDSLTPQVIAVANMDSTKNLANTSNYGPLTVGIAAPGLAVCSSVSASKTSVSTSLLSGTSMSAPIVAFAAGFARANRTAYNASDVKKLIENTSSEKVPELLNNFVKDGSVLNVDGIASEIARLIDAAIVKPPPPPPQPLPKNPLSNSSEVVPDSKFVGPSCQYHAGLMQKYILANGIRIPASFLWLFAILLFWSALKIKISPCKYDKSGI